jgi:hypothetical protein
LLPYKPPKYNNRGEEESSFVLNHNFLCLSGM